MTDNQDGSLWVHCPICGGKTRTKVYEDTVLIQFPLYCPKCKKEVRIDVVKLKMVMSEEEAAAIIPIFKSVLTALRDQSATPIK